ncbi:MAG: S8 family serine peptidase [candidate division Zixibacteria bacterium]|nr:S8 family serine peptidase [candidate division Zixibacteria bacterium]
MNLTRSTVLVIASMLLLTMSAWPGELSPQLRQQIAAKANIELIPVWIGLPRTKRIAGLKTEVLELASSHRGRYQAAMNLLKEEHVTRQASLLAHLEQLKSQGRATNIKSHWITNIIEVKLAVGDLEVLAARGDIEMIYAVPSVNLIPPEKTDPAQSMSTAGVETNLSFINADAAWAAGYTGAGRVICSFDTGVDGHHPALVNNWKGHDGDSAAAWFDPQDQQPFPHILTGKYPSHGTHVMGILVGHDDATGDTIGVAPDAEWISAAVINISGASIIDAFEWAADPDGDPNSIDDLPDVINHSWGVKDIDCQSIFFDMIDNLEALGIVNIFGAGNESAVSSIRNPANRALDSLDCFAVGNVRPELPLTIDPSSSRGPSDCNGAIKPNVVAPGYTIRSSIPYGNYSPMTGTSMSTPHVSGLVALLRQKNPNATVDEIKKAILTTAADHGHNLPDNNYGWGLIDCMAALNALSAVNAAPNVRIYTFDHDPIEPGDTVEGTVVMQNLGASVSNVSATITGSYPSLTPINGSAYFGSINEGDTLRSNDTIRVVVSDTVTPGSVLSLDFLITGDGYSQPAKLFFLVESKLQRSIATHDIGRITYSVTNFGTYGLGDHSFFPGGGLGFQLDNTGNDLWESGLIIGSSAANISDGVRNPAGEPDGDFKVLPGGNIQLLQPGNDASQETYSIFDDSRAEAPLGLKVIQQSYAYDTPPNDVFIIMRYIISNENSYPLSGIRLGLYSDWDVLVFTNNAGGWDSDNSILWTAYNNGSTINNYRGMTVIDGQVTTGLTASGSLITWDNFGDGFTEDEKYVALSDGFASASTYVDSSIDLLQLIAVGPKLFTAGSVDTVAFAIVAGASQSDLVVAAADATWCYDSLINNPTPDAPVISNIPDQTITEGGSFATISLDDYVFDINNTDAEMTWSYSGNVELLVDITARVATITAPADWNGTEMITFRATDPVNLYDEDVASFTVLADGPNLICSPGSLEFSADRGKDGPSAKILNLTTSDNSSVSWSASKDSSWLSISPTSGGTPQEISVSITDTDLPLTVYHDTITITSTEIANSPLSIPIILTINAPAWALDQNYPNPFNPSTSIRYSLYKRCQVTIDVYNILGQRVTTLVDKVQSASTYEIQWDGTDFAGKKVATGLYFYRLKAGGHVEAKKMLLIK